MAYLRTDELAETRDHLHNLTEHIRQAVPSSPHITDELVEALDGIVEELTEDIAALEEIQQMELHEVYEDDRWLVRVCPLNVGCRMCAIDKTKDEDDPTAWKSASDIADALNGAYYEPE